jgi:ribosomal protein S13
MVDSILPFRTDKSKQIAQLYLLNMFQFFSQRYGIGRNISNLLVSYSGYHKKIKYAILEKKNSYVLFRYKDFFIEKKKYLDNFVLEDMKNNIKRYISDNSLKGKRLRLGMPVRGQRVKTNGNTSKKLRAFLRY